MKPCVCYTAPSVTLKVYIEGWTRPEGSAVKASTLPTEHVMRRCILRVCAQDTKREAWIKAGGCSLVGCGRHKSPARLMEVGKTPSEDQLSESGVHCILSAVFLTCW